MSSEEARAALEESVRRISSIALVHETLSQDSHERVDFDRVAGRVVQMVQEGFADPERPMRFKVDGSAGDLPSEIATPLALIVAELIQNAVEHAAGEDGTSLVVSLEMARTPARVRLAVADDGRGMPPGFTLDGDANLGLQIVRTLVESELGGSIEITPNEPGTRVSISVPLDRGRGPAT